MKKFDLSTSKIQSIVSEAIFGADDGELFIEETQSESLLFDDGRLKTAHFNTREGFGLRAVSAEACGYASSNKLTENALLQAAKTVSSVRSGYSGNLSLTDSSSVRNLYQKTNPIFVPAFDQKVLLLQEIDQWLRKKNTQVRQVSLSLASSWQNISIIRADGRITKDERPLVRINISVVVGQGTRQETGSYGMGGRSSFDTFLSSDIWKKIAEEALRQALINLSALPAPAGVFDVVLGNGWPGVMLHEAVGHGLEADFNRKKTSAFAGLLGTQVAAKGLTVIDDGSIPEKRGSINTDDEGTPSNRTVLIEDGKLVGYMQDRQNAYLMGMKPTGNGRRESYASQPMPRMTNTFMLNGSYTPEEIIASVENGIYAVSFGGGQVDITSGKFVFECTEAYRIENGKIKQPIKGAMLIGEGPKAMQRISMIGNDMKLDPGIGTCGKAGQNVPVCVGQPHLRMDGMTLGGTATSA